MLRFTSGGKPRNGYTTMEDTMKTRQTISAVKPEEARTVHRARHTTLKQKIKLIRGKMHRFYVGHFDKAYVERHLARRKGECKRCGACCQLLFHCAFAAECKEGIGCKIYKNRPVNCRIFPLHPRDLSERDIVAPNQPCGYYFEERHAAQKSQAK